tara:strand:+ start:71 stop:385 length:315 start_codon:yes stop_codon:yes gene_type:complete
MTNLQVAQFRVEVIAPNGTNIGCFALTPGQATRMLVDLKCKIDYDKEIAIDRNETEDVERYDEMMMRCWDGVRLISQNIDIQETPDRYKSFDNGIPILDEEEEE